MKKPDEKAKTKDEAKFEEEMSRQFKLFMKAHFGDPTCEECLKNFPE